jgi:hypothetical protein
MRRPPVAVFKKTDASRIGFFFAHPYISRCGKKFCVAKESAARHNAAIAT